MICERRDVKGVNTQTETQKISLEKKCFMHCKAKKEKKKNLNSLQYNSGYTSKYHKEYIQKIIAKSNGAAEKQKLRDFNSI